MKLQLALALILASGCTSTTSTIGQRADGLRVSCEEHDGFLGCDPMEADEGSPEDDGCRSWIDGGPAVVLWPPNHKFHTISVDDCAVVRDDCRATEVAREIVALTSDEPVEVGAGGDGHTTDFDMAFVNDRTVRLRSERQGGGDGRVYSLHLLGPDGATDVCEVHVPHDRGPHGGAVDSGESVRVER